MTLFVGICISSYSIVDAVGVTYMNPISVIFFLGLCTLAPIFPVILIKYRNEVKMAYVKYKGTIMLIGVLQPLTYLMILYAYQNSNLGYIAAIRECSVVVGSLLGFFVLKEDIDIIKILVIILIVSGVLVIKFS